MRKPFTFRRKKIFFSGILSIIYLGLTTLAIHQSPEIMDILREPFCALNPRSCLPQSLGSYVVLLLLFPTMFLITSLDRLYMEITPLIMIIKEPGIEFSLPDFTILVFYSALSPLIIFAASYALFSLIEAFSNFKN